MGGFRLRWQAGKHEAPHGAASPAFRKGAKMRARTILLTCLFAAASLAAAADTVSSHFDRSFPAKPGGTLKVEASFQDVTVAIAPGAQVHVVVDMKMTAWPAEAKKYLDAFEPVFKEEGDTLLVRSRAGVHFMVGFVSSEGKIEITMPTGMNIELDTGSGNCTVKGDASSNKVSCDTGSGDVLFDGSARELKANTGSGDVTAAVSGPIEKALFDTGSGDVTFTGQAALFSADTGSGNVTANGLIGEASFDTGSGDVTAAWPSLAEGSKLSADTGSGSVEFKMPAGAAPGGVLDTSSGDVRCDFPASVEKRGTHWALSGAAGSARLKVSTGSGDIKIIGAR